MGLSSLASEPCYSEICKKQKDFLNSLEGGLQKQTKETMNWCKECRTYFAKDVYFCKCCGFHLKFSKHIKKKPKVYY